MERSFLITVQVTFLITFLKKRLRNRYFSMSFTKFLRTDVLHRTPLVECVCNFVSTLFFISVLYSIFHLSLYDIGKPWNKGKAVLKRDTKDKIGQKKFAYSLFTSDILFEKHNGEENFRIFSTKRLSSLS